ncbi:SusC/RagA family TonB-linked outer membrane protein [Puteibacter caeruleilacunae]|nr:SusC/RagA family TonB-linked outer membrane protein [Puteibacter caeruleilacunae]
MKLTAFLVLITLLQVSASSYSQTAKLNIVGRNLTLEEVFDKIENQSEFSFMYNLKQIDLGKKVNVDLKNKNLEQVLKDILDGTNITYTINNRLVVIHKNGNKTNKFLANQSKKITGTVVDEDGQTLPGVAVMIKGTTTGVVTNVDGKYSLENVTPEATLSFTFVGMLSQDIVVGEQTTINVTMRADAIGIEEVVAIGYGTMKKGNLTTAVTSIDQSTLKSKSEPTITQALQGEIAGLLIVGKGKPGESPSMQLRGPTSLNSSGSPLVLIDGVPGDFNFLNPNDIESYTLLKDAASAAIYGSRAANGVLLITTKRGTTGKPKFNYDGYVGFLSPTETPETVDSYTWATLRNESQVNANEQITYTDEELQKFKNGSEPNKYPNTDWLGLLLENSKVTRHSISANGGTDDVKYMVSGSYDYQTGVISNVDQKVFNVRTAIDIKLSKKLNMSFDMRYNLRENDEAGGNIEGFVGNLYKMNPTMLAYYTDGTYGYNAWAIPNAIGAFEQAGIHEQNNHDANGIFKVDYKILPGLTFNGIANVNYKNKERTAQGKKWSLTDYFTKETVEFGTNTLKEWRKHESYYNLQALLNYEKSFGKHNIKALLGYQQENYRGEWLDAYRTNFPTDVLTVLNAGPSENWSNGGSAEHWAIASGLGRINYDFDNKYMVTFSVRTDGSSRFSEGNQWSTFPSIAAAWRVTGENFAQGITSKVDDLKLRVSLGETGSSSGLGLYPSYTTIGMGGIVLDNQWSQTAYLKAIGNEDLKWERTRMLDIGMDAIALDGHLNFTFDWYRKFTKDILIKLPVPYEYGFGDTKVNIGEVENKGWEVQAAYNDKIGDWSYGVSVNLSNNKNKVLDLAETGPWKGSRTITQVGLPLNSFYLYKSDGYFQSQQEVTDHAKQHNENAAGDIRYVDQITVDTNDDGIPDEADGKINGDDRVAMGNSNPHYLYGIKLTGGWKNFDASIFFQGVGKHEIFVSGGGIQPLTDNGHGPISKHQLDYWTTNNTNSAYPRLLASNKTNSNYWNSDFWVRDAAYLRCKNIQIGYTLPKNVISRLGFDYLRFFASGSNLFTITDFIDGYDPETPGQNNYPLARTFAFGLNIKF